jgi:hypothetical protein
VPYSVSDLLTFTDLQVAGLAWLMRTRHFDRLSQELDERRCLSIEGSEMLGRPADTLIKVARFFEIDADPQEIGMVASGDVLRRHSKEGRSYGWTDRQRDFASARALFGAEVDAVASWVEEVASTEIQVKSSSSSQ